VLEEHVNATLTSAIEDQPAWFAGHQEPVLTLAAAAAFAAGAAIVTGAYAAGAAMGSTQPTHQ
jgi:hypothetical protein